MLTKDNDPRLLSLTGTGIRVDRCILRTLQSAYADLLDSDSDSKEWIQRYNRRLINFNDGLCSFVTKRTSKKFEQQEVRKNKMKNHIEHVAGKMGAQSHHKNSSQRTSYTGRIIDAVIYEHIHSEKKESVNAIHEVLEQRADWWDVSSEFEPFQLSIIAQKAIAVVRAGGVL